MPLAKLFVEGTLEVQIFTPILLGNPVPQQGGSKDTLRARAGTERRENKVEAGYLRDRDFDSDPPADLTKPSEERTFENSGVPFGWRWCRHEIENYLIEPAIVSEAMSWHIPHVENILRESARRIRNYEAARWTVGVVRRALPPHYELRTRPDGLNEIDLPPALDPVTVTAWLRNASKTIGGLWLLPLLQILYKHHLIPLQPASMMSSSQTSRAFCSGSRAKTCWPGCPTGSSPGPCQTLAPFVRPCATGSSPIQSARSNCCPSGRRRPRW